MKVWLIRHGMTRLGEEKRYQGALDEGLSAQGRAALKRAAFTPSRVYVSPLLRARETAGLLFPASEQIVVPDLREMDFGVFEGRGWWEMEQDEDYCAWVDGGCTGRCPGGAGHRWHCSTAGAYSRGNTGSGSAPAAVAGCWNITGNGTE